MYHLQQIINNHSQLQVTGFIFDRQQCWCILFLVPIHFTISLHAV